MGILNKIINYSIACVILVLSVNAVFLYKGSVWYYVLFTLSFNALLFAGFSKNHTFFDSFMGIFLWLGFWLKTTVRIIFFESKFYEETGKFDYLGSSFDSALLVSSVGAIGFLVAYLLRFRKMKYDSEYQSNQPYLNWYKKHSLLVWSLFLFLYIFWSLFNFYFGVYQRGIIPKTNLPYGLSGILKWLLLFGGASFSSFLLHCALNTEKNKTPLFLYFLSLLEVSISNISMLSRGMIMNGSALLFGVYKYTFKSIKLVHYLFVISVFCGLFATSIYSVSYLRSKSFKGKDVIPSLENVSGVMKILILDRWVGIEGVMAVVSHSQKSWSTFKEALQDEYKIGQLAFYDRVMISSPYTLESQSKFSFASIPGIIAFLYYTGSFWFLFFSCILAGLIGPLFEWAAYKLCDKNIIFSSILGQVVAYRFSHFGNFPKQSYLLFGSLILNILIFYLVIRILNSYRVNSLEKISPNN